MATGFFLKWLSQRSQNDHISWEMIDNSQEIIDISFEMIDILLTENKYANLQRKELHGVSNDIHAALPLSVVHEMGGF